MIYIVIISNLRNTIKEYLYKELKCARHNYGIIQNKRRENLALCVEEESSQKTYWFDNL